MGRTNDLLEMNVSDDDEEEEDNDNKDDVNIKKNQTYTVVEFENQQQATQWMNVNLDKCCQK